GLELCEVKGDADESAAQAEIPGGAGGLQFMVALLWAAYEAPPAYFPRGMALGNDQSAWDRTSSGNQRRGARVAPSHRPRNRPASIAQGETMKHEIKRCPACREWMIPRWNQKTRKMSWGHV